MLTILSLTVLSAQQSLSRTFSNIKEIKLNINVGELQVERAGGSSVEVLVYYNEEDVRPEMNAKGSRLVLDEEMLTKRDADKTRWTLRIPDDLTLKSNIGVGDAMFSKLSIDLDHNSGVGKVSLAGLRGQFKINSGTGNIDCDASEGEFDLNSGTGSVSLNQLQGTIKANSGTGSVKADGLRIDGKSSFNSGTGSVRASSVAVGAESSFNSGTGNTNVSLTAPLGADISVNSGTSSATLEFNGQPISGRFEMDCEERRGKIIAPFTFDSEEVYRQGGNTRIKKTARIGKAEYEVKVSSGTSRAVVKE